MTRSRAITDPFLGLGPSALRAARARMKPARRPIPNRSFVKGLNECDWGETGPSLPSMAKAVRRSTRHYSFTRRCPRRNHERIPSSSLSALRLLHSSFSHSLTKLYKPCMPIVFVAPFVAVIDYGSDVDETLQFLLRLLNANDHIWVRNDGCRTTDFVVQCMYQRRIRPGELSPQQVADPAPGPRHARRTRAAPVRHQSRRAAAAHRA